MRIRFAKGDQRKFITKVLLNSKCPSLRSLINRGFEVSYSTLKSYYVENRTIPEDLFVKLCIFSGLNPEDFKVKKLEDSWGQVLGGKH